MRYAIVESGGKQYKAVEGQVIEVDRLPDGEGAEISLERVLLLADGDDRQVGTPMLGGVEIKVTVVSHFSGPKVRRFRYSPKKRIRVHGGHRQQYTRLMVESIGGKGVAPRAAVASEADAAAPPKTKVPSKPAERKSAAKKTPGDKIVAKKPKR
jgi:large subunit ribosomal protein L21